MFIGVELFGFCKGIWVSPSLSKYLGWVLHFNILLKILLQDSIRFETIYYSPNWIKKIIRRLAEAQYYEVSILKLRYVVPSWKECIGI